MNDLIPTQCLLFPDLLDKPVLPRLEEHHGSSDGR
jgi:hypothetical protein